MTAARQPPGAALVDYLVAAYGLAGFERDLTLRLNALVTEAIAAERERCVKIAENGCLVPPDGGSPTEDEVEMCKSIAAFIRHGSDECMP
jgi:hypothetical protein